jgi:hypothetical protein
VQIIQEFAMTESKGRVWKLQLTEKQLMGSMISFYQPQFFTENSPVAVVNIRAEILLDLSFMSITKAIKPTVLVDDSFRKVIPNINI